MNKYEKILNGQWFTRIPITYRSLVRNPASVEMVYFAYFVLVLPSSYSLSVDGVTDKK